MQVGEVLSHTYREQRALFAQVFTTWRVAAVRAAEVRRTAEASEGRTSTQTPHRAVALRDAVSVTPESGVRLDVGRVLGGLVSGFRRQRPAEPPEMPER